MFRRNVRTTNKATDEFETYEFIEEFEIHHHDFLNQKCAVHEFSENGIITKLSPKADVTKVSFYKKIIDANFEKDLDSSGFVRKIPKTAENSYRFLQENPDDYFANG